VAFTVGFLLISSLFTMIDLLVHFFFPGLTWGKIVLYVSSDSIRVMIAVKISSAKLLVLDMILMWMSG